MKICVAMSGGVDSSVAAALLKEQGHEVAGVFMRNWTNEGKKIATLCPWEEDERDVREVGKILGLPTYLWDFQIDYQELIFNPFLRGLEEGVTPNPDCACNRYIKFGAFLDRAQEAGFEIMATGHYARKIDNHLALGIDSNKDQSYFLSQITRAQLARAFFPIGNLTKKEVRALATKYKLPVSDKPDSQGLCFVGRIKVADFLRANLEKKSGQIINIDTKEIIGEHDGVWFYTLGQRHGLKIGGGVPYYVVKKDLSKNILYVAMGPNHTSLFSQECLLENLNWLENVKLPISCDVRTRYRQILQKACVEKVSDDILKVKFTEPQRALTPSQVVALYKNEIVLGSGVIYTATPKTPLA